MSHNIDSRVNSLIEAEINKLVDEIAWIDSRLLELDNTDESNAERKLLLILRKHLVKDLYELSGFIYDENAEGDIDEGTMVIASALSSEIRTTA
ncbi:MAG: hypothetical protein LRS48_06265 [Desulfurococcales archaeon]|nr:hypothetical protein [Desulfurococcales archaeon]